MAEGEDERVPYCIGIDEAGRGPVLGPMIYACAYCPVSEKDSIREKYGFADSKQLSEQDRDGMFMDIMENLGWIYENHTPSDLSNKMLRRAKYNLNQISHDSAISLIRKVIAKGYKVTEVYVDTVGKAYLYKNKLMKVFDGEGITFTVESKADDSYPIVSAASIVAKVTRDQLVRNWIFEESDISPTKEFGSGYPGDEVTRKWLTDNWTNVFGYPSFVRFSWKTVEDKLEAVKAAPVVWHEDMHTPSAFTNNQKRVPYFHKRGMKIVTEEDF